MPVSVVLHVSVQNMRVVAIKYLVYTQAERSDSRRDESERDGKINAKAALARVGATTTTKMYNRAFASPGSSYYNQQSSND